ncbi:serine--tRNA ligase [Buchnera aphidicola (Ceratovacuna keduensis)]|uniref:serine--tRNA ligase n=1 Tax=Buchnera aphidicola TaxID=9 RepID=UPI0031B87A68
MLDITILKNNIDIFYKKLKRRGFILDINYINNINKEIKKVKFEKENLEHYRNKTSKKIGFLKLSNKNYKNLKKEVIYYNKILLKKKLYLHKLEKKILKYYYTIPNIPDKETKFGKNFKDNFEVYKWGNIKKYDFKLKDHVELGKKRKNLDFYNSSKISGSNFFILKDKLSLLYRSLSQFMLDVHVENHKYIEIYVPYLVRKKCLYGTGQLPKFYKDLIYTKCSKDNVKKDFKKEKLFLIPTSEVPLTNLFMNDVIEENKLPLFFVSNTPCFRNETTSYGIKNKGLIRTKQFDKVEMVQFVHPEKSNYYLEIITEHAEKILKLLNLPYRKMSICTNDIGFSSSKSYDLEVWFPYQKKYVEISSCSNMKDFQSRRINIKFLDKNKNKRYVHTLNGSGLAVGRTLAAIMENYQCKNGKIKIPNILKNRYMKGLEFI